MVPDLGSELHARLAMKERDLHAAELAASQLEGFGFHVTSVSERGVGFDGSVDVFESIFESKVIVAGARPRFATRPATPVSLADTVESVYFPTRPTYFV